jgi:UDP-GlcNAc3NAcA epimerase
LTRESVDHTGFHRGFRPNPPHNTATLKVVSVVGARPQFIKAAPVIRAAQRAGVEHLLVHTGQHYDRLMSDVFFEELDLPPPKHALGVGSGSHGAQTAAMMQRLDPILVAEAPDWVLVYGDTNSTIAAALTSAKLGMPVAHIEAGLRSFNRSMPEEINRVVSDHVSTVLFCPSLAAIQNLSAEGFNAVLAQGALVEPDTIPAIDAPTPDQPVVLNCGDVMYDSILMYNSSGQRSEAIAALGLEPREYYLVTIHRAGNSDSSEVLARLISILSQLDKPVVFPVHPRTAARLRDDGIRMSADIRLIDPLGYFDMLSIERSAAAIVTDSGGVQKEAFYFGVPCITLRDETEWVETVSTGWNVLVGADVENALHAIRGARPGQDGASPYGTGRAAETIVRFLGRFPRQVL